MKNTAGDVAAKTIIDICKLKYKVKSASICIEIDAQIRNDIIFLTNITEPITGKNYCEYPNGVTKSKGDIQNGKKNNKWIWLYQDGQIGLEKNYNNGKKHGKIIKWYAVNSDEIALNGQMHKEENYIDDKKGGKSTWWYKNGMMHKE